MSNAVSPSIGELNPIDLMHSAPFGLAILDRDDVILWTNEMAAEMLGQEAKALSGYHWHDLPLEYHTVVSDKVDKFHISTGKDNQGHWIKRVRRPLSEDETDGRHLCCLIDITQTENANARRRNLKTMIGEAYRRDPVTGLLDKMALTQHLDAQISRSRRYNNPLSLIMMRVEGYEACAAKSRLGNDQIRRIVAGQLMDRMRWVDITGRWEDNHFLLVLPETRLSDTARLIDNLRSYLQYIMVPDQSGVQCKLALTFAVTEWEKGDDSMRLLQRVSNQMTPSPEPNNP